MEIGRRREVESSEPGDQEPVVGGESIEKAVQQDPGPHKATAPRERSLEPARRTIAAELPHQTSEIASREARPVALARLRQAPDPGPSRSAGLAAVGDAPLRQLTASSLEPAPPLRFSMS